MSGWESNQHWVEVVSAVAEFVVVEPGIIAEAVVVKTARGDLEAAVLGAVLIASQAMTCGSSLKLDGYSPQLY